MEYSLSLLQIAKEGLPKEAFIQHVYNLFYIQLEVNDTYNTLFNKLLDKFKDNSDKLLAIEDWIQYNRENIKEANSSADDILGYDKSIAMFDLMLITG